MKCPYCQAESHVVDTREVASAIIAGDEMQRCSSAGREQLW
ncbi:MAG: hypothetical protein U0802_26775 [Candidatus Binatia bacterium]